MLIYFFLLECLSFSYRCTSINCIFWMSFGWLHVLQISSHSVLYHQLNNSDLSLLLPNVLISFAICTLVSSVQFSRSVMSDSLQPHGLQHARPLCPSPTPGACSNSCPSSRWCHPTISSSVIPFSSCLQSFPASGSFQWVSSSHQVAKVLEFQLQHQSFQWTFTIDLLWDWLVWSPCSPSDSQESSLIPQFKTISSSVLIFLYSPTLTSIHDYWKNHSFD